LVAKNRGGKKKAKQRLAKRKRGDLIGQAVSPTSRGKKKLRWKETRGHRPARDKTEQLLKDQGRGKGVTEAILKPPKYSKPKETENRADGESWGGRVNQPRNQGSEGKEVKGRETCAA